VIIDEASLIPAVNTQRGNKLTGTVFLAEDFAVEELACRRVAELMFNLLGSCPAAMGACGQHSETIGRGRQWRGTHTYPSFCLRNGSRVIVYALLIVI